MLRRAPGQPESRSQTTGIVIPYLNPAPGQLLAGNAKSCSRTTVIVLPDNQKCAPSSLDRAPGQPGWEEVLSLAKFDNVVVKCTATPGLAGAPSTPAGFGAATLELLGRFGASRLLWGSNFPHASTQEYVEIWGWFDRWCEEQLSEQERGMLAGGTAASLYAFGGLAAPSSGGAVM